MSESTQQLIDWFGLYLATLLYCFLSGVIPFLNVEIFLVAVAAWQSERATVCWVMVLAALAQMAAKGVLYASGSGALRRRWLKPRHQEALQRLHDKMAHYRGSIYTFVFISSLVGLPPFYLVSILCGMMRVNLWRFFFIGLAGRVLRFTALMFFPHLIRTLFA